MTCHQGLFVIFPAMFGGKHAEAPLTKTGIEI